jgi:hypothetical protein
MLSPPGKGSLEFQYRPCLSRDLSNNKISEIHDDAFVGLDSLEDM